MPKIGMEKIRKRQVIEAALHQLCIGNLTAFTLDKVAKRAGVSKGVVTYYFKNKEELIFKSFDSLLLKYFDPESMHEYRDMPKIELLELISKQVLGIGTDNVERAHFYNLNQKQIMQLLIQMYSKATTDEAFKELVKSHYSNYFSGLFSIICSESSDKKKSEMLTLQLMALLDGLLLYQSVDFKPSDVTDFDIVMDFISRSV